MLYVVSNQMNILFYENMRNDFAKSFLVLPSLLHIPGQPLNNLYMLSFCSVGGIIL